MGRRLLVSQTAWLWAVAGMVAAFSWPARGDAGGERSKGTPPQPVPADASAPPAVTADAGAPDPSHDFSCLARLEAHTIYSPDGDGLRSYKATIAPFTGKPHGWRLTSRRVLDEFKEERLPE